VTTRTDEIKATLTALSATVTDHKTRTEALAGKAEHRADITLNHGWDGLSLGYTTAAEDLDEIATEIKALGEHLDHGVTALDQIHDDTALTDVATHLTTADAHLNTASTSIEAIAVHLDDTRTHLETTGEEHLTGLLAALVDDFQTAAQTLSTIRDDITDELTATNTSTSGPGGPPPSGPQDAISERITELRRQGHAPQRHGGQITDQQLTDRALRGIDPMTGTTTDGEHGGTHKCGRNATKFITDEALVRAEDFARNSEIYRIQQRENEITGKPFIAVRVPLMDVFGTSYLSQVKGIRRAGSKSKPTGDPPGSRPPTPSNFENGSLLAVFVRTNDGSYNLKTAYPDPED